MHAGRQAAGQGVTVLLPSGCLLLIAWFIKPSAAA